MNPIQTTATTVWMDDDIVHIRSKGIVSTTESVTETLAAARSLSGEIRFPVLFDATEWPSGTPGAWMTVIEELPAVFCCVAMVMPDGNESRVGQFPELLNQMTIPFRVFNNTTEAREFLVERRLSD